MKTQTLEQIIQNYGPVMAADAESGYLVSFNPQHWNIWAPALQRATHPSPTWENVDGCDVYAQQKHLGLSDLVTAAENILSCTLADKNELEAL